MNSRRTLAATLAALTLIALLAAGCSDDDSASDKKKSTTTESTTTVPASPTTVSDDEFDKAATTSETLIADAGDDPCKVIEAFPQASNLPLPANPAQTERGVQVVVMLFNTAADTAPATAQADAAVLRKAATDLEAEGAAKAYDPAWLTTSPGPAAISDPAVSTAYQNYQTEVSKTCAPTTTAG